MSANEAAAWRAVLTATRPRIPRIPPPRPAEPGPLPRRDRNARYWPRPIRRKDDT